MTPPALEIADLIRTAGAAFVERNRQWIRWKHVKVLLAIARCRTAALGGHFDECTRCAHRAPISYNRCRDRHCPKCQTAARERWIAARRRELLPTRYLHVVFTLPRHLAPVVLQNKKVIYDLLFRASAETPRSRSRSQTPRCRDWFLQCVAHLEPKGQASSPCPLCGARRRSLARSHPLGPLGGQLLPAQSGTA